MSENEVIASLRQARDRFLAFAFCRADLLIELSDTHKIVFISGATQSLFGRTVDDLTGQSLLDLVVPHERPVLHQLLNGMVGGDRPDPINIRFVKKSKEPRDLSITGYYVEDLEKHFFLSCKIPSAHAVTAPQVHDRLSFGQAVIEHQKSNPEDKLTFIELENYDEFSKRLTKETRSELSETINSYLRASSSEANSAASFGNGRYGLISRPDLDIEHLSNEITRQVQAADPTGVGLKIEKASIALADSGISGGNAAQALSFMIQQFAQDHNQAFSLEELAHSLPEILVRIQKTATRIKNVINGADFMIVFQPIIDLKTRRTHHYEVLARINDETGSPQDFIRSAEDLNLIKGFDLAVCRKAIKWLENNPSKNFRRQLAVNLSAASIGEQDFIEKLIPMLEPFKDTPEKLLFEITESTKIPDPVLANQSIQSLRKLGHKVCLDDFGVGEASLQYLRMFQIDILKIDGSYVREALNDTTSTHILSSIADLCKKLNITTVAEMVEDEATTNMLIGCAIDLGQGYYFGRPCNDITVFEEPDKPKIVVRRGQSSETWS
ncbi:EAL domain-containing protein [Kiloniella laminariae]|uniref:EAL domain-containing protein n=1 Tax=Kiloniella laminariae TaxID=454162 RepID=A0ABT4LJ05_9PROT|nr:EAL domain-containing protein [Kiloniella laminariae]MCZ4281089.1 EAL domain-containing protein [Kiloniella laminariae]